MKIIMLLYLISSYVYSQTYLEINYNNNDPLNSTDLGLISNINFSETDINFLLNNNMNVSKPISTISKITFSSDNGGNPLPVEHNTFTLDQYTLSQNYPNPFNPSTTIEFNIPYRAQVEVNIFDVTGQLINRIINDFLEEGHHSTIWEAKNQVGQIVVSGVYIYQIKFDNKIISKKMLFIK